MMYGTSAHSRTIILEDLLYLAHSYLQYRSDILRHPSRLPLPVLVLNKLPALILHSRGSGLLVTHHTIEV